jgi:hypothetical protein
MAAVKKYRVAAAISVNIQPTVLKRFHDQAMGFKTKKQGGRLKTGIS